jgi:hypothetical protein
MSLVVGILQISGSKARDFKNLASLKSDEQRLDVRRRYSWKLERRLWRS